MISFLRTIRNKIGLFFSSIQQFFISNSFNSNRFFSILTRHKFKFLFFLILVLLFLISPNFVYAKGISKFVLEILNYLVYYLFITPLVWAITIMFQVLVAFAAYNDFMDNIAVIKGWVIVRDLANMFVIVFLLIIAFGIMLRIESYGNRKLLVKLLLMAVLINFSKTICGFFIDISQIVMLTFVNGFKVVSGVVFAESFGVLKFLTLNTNTKGEFATMANGLLGLVLAVLFYLAILAVIVVTILTLVWRIVNLWLLVVLSPFAFLGSAVPFLKDFYSEWRQNFINYLVNGPLLAFFLWLALSVMNSFSGIAEVSQEEAQRAVNFTGQGASILEKFGAEAGNVASQALTGGNISLMFISLGILVAGLQMANRYAAIGASKAESMIKSGQLLKRYGKTMGKMYWRGAKGVARTADLLSTGGAIGRLGGRVFGGAVGIKDKAVDFWEEKKKGIIATRGLGGFVLPIGKTGKFQGVKQALEQKEIELEEAKKTQEEDIKVAQYKETYVKQAGLEGVKQKVESKDLEGARQILTVLGEEGLLNMLKDDKGMEIEKLEEDAKKSFLQQVEERIQAQTQERKQIGLEQEKENQAKEALRQSNVLDERGNVKALSKPKAVSQNLKEIQQEAQKVQRLEQEVQALRGRLAVVDTFKTVIEGKMRVNEIVAKKLEQVEKSYIPSEIESVNGLVNALLGAKQRRGEDKKLHMQYLIKQAVDKGVIFDVMEGLGYSKDAKGLRRLINDMNSKPQDNREIPAENGQLLLNIARQAKREGIAGLTSVVIHNKQNNTFEWGDLEPGKDGLTKQEEAIIGLLEQDQVTNMERAKLLTSGVEKGLNKIGKEFFAKMPIKAKKLLERGLLSKAEVEALIENRREVESMVPDEQRQAFRNLLEAIKREGYQVETTQTTSQQTQTKSTSQTSDDQSKKQNQQDLNDVLTDNNGSNNNSNNT